MCFGISIPVLCYVGHRVGQLPHQARRSGAAGRAPGTRELLEPLAHPWLCQVAAGVPG